MSAHDIYVWSAVAGLTVICVLTRSAFLMLPSRWRPGPAAEPWLRFAPLAALAALVAPDAVLPALALLDGQGLPAEADAGARLMAVLADARAPSAFVLVAVGAWRKSALAGLLSGVACYLALRWLA